MKTIYHFPFKSIGCILTLLIFAAACQNDSKPKEAIDGTSTSSEDTTEVIRNQTEETTTNPVKIDDYLYPWVDQLNIRNAPNSKAKIVASVPENEALTFTGEKSEAQETIVLRGVAYNEPWFKIVTKDQKEGWVFGGAVKRDGEVKGNAIINDQQFEFPHFGKYHLKDWTKLSSQDESGGDAEINTTIYKKENQFLEMTIVEVGEYGYSRTYRLLDADKKVLKERLLDFEIDPLILREIVNDYTSQPVKKYSRSQTMKQHFMQLNTRPLMVSGQWTESTGNGNR